MISWILNRIRPKKSEPDQEYYSYCKWIFHEDGTVSNIHITESKEEMYLRSPYETPTTLDLPKMKP